MEKAQENAFAIVHWLEKQKEVKKVIYPGIATHPGYGIMKKQSRGFGAMITFEVTNEGDGVLIQQPVYYPFSEVINNNGRKPVSNTLVQDGTGKYRIDFEDFEEKIVAEKIKLFFCVILIIL